MEDGQSLQRRSTEGVATSDVSTSKSGASADGKELRAAPVARIVTSALIKGALSLVPGGGFVAETINVVEQRAEQKKQEVAALAMAALQDDTEALKAKLDDDDELAALWIRGLSAAQAARTAEKSRVFAGILAGAVNATHHQRMVANALFRVLEQLEEEHVEVMKWIEIAGAMSAPTEPDGSGGRAGADPTWLEGKVPHLTPVLPVLLATLSSLSITRNAWQNTWGGIEGRVALVLTDLGIELLRAFRAQTEV